MSQICPYPFTQLFLMPSGKITPCCYLAQDPLYFVGDIQHQSLKEIWNSNKMRTLRRELLSGKPVICKRQIKASNCNLIRKDLIKNIEPKEIMPFPMIRLDMMLNGQCNLECVMCSVWTAPNGVYTRNEFWEEGREKIFPYLKEVDIKGGEPFIQKDVYRLMDEVGSVNSECLWHITTNAHYRFTDKIRASVNKIRIIRLSISIDSLDPENFSRIRKKGDLSKVVRTLDDWIAYKNSEGARIDQINCNFVVQKANWHEVPQFYEFCREKGICPFFIILTNPESFSILNLPVEDRRKMLEFYLSAMTMHCDRVYYRIIRPLLETLSPVDMAQMMDQHADVFSSMEKFGPSIAEVTS
jgi:MoaA/NifB/PqqE/SkfB family radical SAM enzyme